MSPLPDDLKPVFAQAPLELKGQFMLGSNYTFLVDVLHEGDPLQAVYKPVKGERPLWDFPENSLAGREVAAYLVSETLGWSLVPYTILREDGPYGPGSLQEYIEYNPNYHYFNFRDADKTACARSRSLTPSSTTPTAKAATSSSKNAPVISTPSTMDCVSTRKTNCGRWYGTLPGNRFRRNCWPPSNISAPNSGRTVACIPLYWPISHPRKLPRSTSEPKHCSLLANSPNPRPTADPTPTRRCKNNRGSSSRWFSGVSRPAFMNDECGMMNDELRPKNRTTEKLENF